MLAELQPGQAAKIDGEWAFRCPRCRCYSSICAPFSAHTAVENPDGTATVNGSLVCQHIRKGVKCGAHFSIVSGRVQWHE